MARIKFLIMMSLKISKLSVWQSAESIFLERFFKCIQIDSFHQKVRFQHVGLPHASVGNVKPNMLGHRTQRVNQHYDIIICVYWFELFSQVSDVAHGPLVFLLSLSDSKNKMLTSKPEFWPLKEMLTALWSVGLLLGVLCHNFENCFFWLCSFDNETCNTEW